MKGVTRPGQKGSWSLTRVFALRTIFFQGIRLLMAPKNPWPASRSLAHRALGLWVGGQIPSSHLLSRDHNKHWERRRGAEHMRSTQPHAPLTFPKSLGARMSMPLLGSKPGLGSLPSLSSRSGLDLGRAAQIHNPRKPTGPLLTSL